MPFVGVPSGENVAFAALMVLVTSDGTRIQRLPTGRIPGS